MEYLKSGLKSVLGSQQPGEQPSGSETVERLVERVMTSTLLDDRRDACRALKALSKKYRLEVGAYGMDAIRTVLAGDRPDSEIVGYALDTLANICSPQVFTEEERPELGHECLLHVGEQFTEIFLKQSDGVSLVLSFLEEYDFKVRWPALKLLSALATNRLRDIQEIILVSPMGVSKLMDLLGDSREVVRNDTLLLLIQLTKGNANIQKIVAFENAFDRLFDIITEEGYSDGGIIVEDCLLLMLNLLRNNTSNQNFFKEGSYIQKLGPMFDLPQESNEDALWSPQKVSNIHCVLQVVRALVSPGSPGQVTLTCQYLLMAAGIVQALCRILMASGVPVDVLTEAICTVGESIRGNSANQEFFSTVLAPFTPPKEAIVVLLMSMVNEKQPFVLRCAVVYCFQCYLFKNETIQAQLVQTLLPSTTEVSNVTCGQLLCSGLFSHDSVSNWFSSVCLSHALIENPVQKEQLLRVLLAATAGNPPVSLLHQASLLLQQCGKVQSKVGLLMLLSTWLSHCPMAVKQFLSIPTAIPYLTTQAGSNERDENEELVQGLCAFLMGICVLFNNDSVASYTKENLRHLIGNRVGRENFVSKLSEVSRHEQYSKAAKQPQPRAANSEELLLDHEFCKLFKALEGMIIKAVTSSGTSDLGAAVDGSDDLGGLTDGDRTITNGDGGPGGGGSGVVARYKDLIRDQDRRLAETQATVLRLQQEGAALESRLEEAAAHVARLTDENMLLRAQVSTVSPAGSEDIVVELGKLRLDCGSKNDEIKKLKDDVTRLESEKSKLQSELERIAASNEAQELRAQIAKLMSDQDDLLELLADQDRKLGAYKEKLKSLGEKVEEDEDISSASGGGTEDQVEES